MPKSPNSRRRFLQSLGLAGAGAALAPYIPTSLAQEAAPPTRVVFITIPNGIDLERWRPTGTEADWTLSESLLPLSDYKDRLLVLDGVDLDITARQGNGKGHGALASLWTGAAIPAGEFSHNAGWQTAPSLDHIMGQRMGRAPIYLGVRRAGETYNGPQNNAHYRGGDGGRINPTMDPRVAFDSLFEGASSTGAQPNDNTAALARGTERRRVADLLSRELSTLERGLSGLDRQIFQAHLAQMSDLETDIARLEMGIGGGVTGACQVPERPDSFAIPMADWSLVPAHLAAQMNVGVRALQCDLSRILCLQWGRSGNCGPAHFLEDFGYPGFGEIHNRTHESLDSEEARQDIANLTTWRMAQIKEQLLDPMDAIDEGNGSLLDNTLVVIASEQSSAGFHSNRNVPFVIIQGRNVGYFQTNRYKKWGTFNPRDVLWDGGGQGYAGGVPHNGVLVGIAHAMGLTDINRVGGDDEIADGVLEGIS